ncbi:hypothetical protein EXIGLDRAFT_675529 [Exidia glandulosa HHB12029]|uniref:HAD-like protein n=1 Tax=Exidia glandulosa HHB12029 TaxID=1314781 RepID=A0A165HKZ6_EXIGL|nr:hypothetical protein EXIGLDRAFT_675529 [Exidia glandulosa HHB12029]
MSVAASNILIAVDLDDVLAQTNAAAARWHNDTYGTQMDLSTFYYYHWWKNPYWGTPRECLHKAQQFYDSPHYARVSPVRDAYRSMRTLRALGYRLVIITARDKDHHALTVAWIDEHFPDCFEGIHYTGEIKSLRDKWGSTRLTRFPQLCHMLGASLLIDDSADNALACAAYRPPVRVLLFGDYAWNRRLSPVATELDKLSFSARRALQADNWWEKETVVLPPGVWRVRDWADTLLWIRNHPL